MKINSIIDLVKDLDTSRQTKNLNKLLIRILLHLQVEFSIEFLGYKSGQELMDLKKNAYFVVVPSEWYENNPMAIIESYCEGVPAIGSRIGGIPEIINEGKTGYIFKPHNTTELTEKIAKASDLSAEVYQQMSDNAISFAHKDMSKESYYKRLLPFYEQLLNNKK